MIALPVMLANAAAEAGMKVPPDPDNFERDEYPHFNVLCFVQLGSSMPNPHAHFDNAKIIAAIPERAIRLVTLTDLAKLGVLADCVDLAASEAGLDDNAS